MRFIFLTIILSFSIPSFSCEYDNTQLDFYISHIEKQNISSDGLRISELPSYKNCPKLITDIYLENKLFVLNIIKNLKNKYIVSEHIEEHIFKPNEQIFPPLLLIKN